MAFHVGPTSRIITRVPRISVYSSINYMGFSTRCEVLAREFIQGVTLVEQRRLQKELEIVVYCTTNEVVAVLNYITLNNIRNKFYHDNFGVQLTHLCCR